MWLDEFAEELPEKIFEGLNGGILLLPEYKISPYANVKQTPNGIFNADLLIMGEYHVDRYLGRMVYIYYGSFIQAYHNASEETLKSQLKHTLYHELIHHLESLAGDRSLEIKDAAYIKKYLKDNK
jgi:hypothetical protein